MKKTALTPFLFAAPSESTARACKMATARLKIPLNFYIPYHHESNSPIMKQIVFSLIIFLISVSFSNAQKQTFDAATYTPIKGWKQQKTNDYVSFSVTDEAKGSFCIITLYKSLSGKAESKTNFDDSWQRMIAGPLSTGNPKMEESSSENGWELQTGTAAFNKGGLAGSAMLITATGQSKVINMVVLINSKSYAAQLTDFIGSIELKRPEASPNQGPLKNSGTANKDLAGIWANNILETSGYANGYPQYTAGYFRQEYTLKSDGTYMYFYKAWSVYSKSVRYMYETGNWSVSGNRLTISPTKGKTEEWSKSTTNSTKEWGKLLRSQDTKLEKVTYSFEIKYYSGSQSTALLLTSAKPTERDGSSNSSSDAQTISYSAKKEATIDFPPGFNFTPAKPVSAVWRANTNSTASGTNGNNRLTPERLQESETSKSMVYTTLSENHQQFYPESLLTRRCN